MKTVLWAGMFNYQITAVLAGTFTLASYEHDLHTNDLHFLENTVPFHSRTEPTRGWTMDEPRHRAETRSKNHLGNYIH